MTSIYSPSPTAIVSRTHTPSPAPSSRSESLVAHPLLVSPASPSPSGPQLTPPHYVPYTPRQRPQLATTNGANATVSQPNHQQQADATRRLQMTNLQSAVQDYGVETHSVGWALLEWLVEGVNESIWSAVHNNKAVILLPLERQEKDKITIEFVKDHVANTLTISSTLHPSSSFFTSFASPSNRQAETISLPPLPPSHPEHPQYVIPFHIPSLPLPYPKLVVPPPLPLRPLPSNSSRISNPFASFFGGGSKRPAPGSISSRSVSPSLSIQSVDGANPDPHPHSVHISACTVNKRILRTQVGAALDLALVQSTQSALAAHPGESLDEVDKWVLDTVLEFVRHWAPLVRIDKKNRTAHYIVNDIWSRDTELLGMEDVGRRMQGFMEEIEGGVKTLLDNGEQEKSSEELKARVTHCLEKVETLLCTLFYDRLFAPLPDAEHDKVLQERIGIAQETLGLDELGIQIDALSPEDDTILEDNSAGLEVIREVTDLCGATLSRLNKPGYICPGKKARTLVEAHKILVDGLSHLPSVRISAKAENDMTGSLELKTLEPSPKPEPVHEPLLSPGGPLTAGSPNSLSPLDVSPLPLPPAPPAPSPLSSDLLLPLLIYTILNTVPQHLLSNLLYVQRFRSSSLSTGEEAFCLVNLLAGVEYLMQIQGPKTPRPPTPPPPQPLQSAPETSSPVRASFLVDALTGSANKMINGVVDSSFGILKSISLLTPSSGPVSLPPEDGTAMAISGQMAGANPNTKIGLGVLKRENNGPGLSLRALTASLPGRTGTPTMSPLALEVEGRPMLVVNGSSDTMRMSSGSSEDLGEEEDGEREEGDEGSSLSDAREIKSFESMMSERQTRSRQRRWPMNDRVASLNGSPASLNRPLKSPNGVDSFGYPPPNPRFMECDEGDLKLAEIGELLNEYRRLVRAVKANGGYAH